MGSLRDFEAKAPFRQYLPDLTTPRFLQAKQQDAYQYVEAFRMRRNPPWLYELTEAWAELLEEPFTGITTDGNSQKGLFEEQSTNLPIATICNAATRVIDTATPKEKAKLLHRLNAREWRCWSNPEFLLRPLGLRLDELSHELAELILRVLEASLSSQGYQKAIGAMRLNQFLGQLVDLPKIMNEFSYNFLIFGQPSTTQAWGWSLYGHHLCLSIFLKGGHITISPTFTGAEPNLIDEGPHAGDQLLHQEGQLGLQFMQSLPVDLQKQAQIFRLLQDPAMMPSGDLKLDRWNHDDQRHLCGAFRDNRVVPYEGIAVGQLLPEQRHLILRLIAEFILYLPSEARRLRLKEVERHFESTYFSWIGEFGPDDAYYFRIQSPVIICEFDHHSGVFLTNEQPAKFHIHTLVRTPNGGDYGNAIRDPSERLS